MRFREFVESTPNDRIFRMVSQRSDWTVPLQQLRKVLSQTLDPFFEDKVTRDLAIGTPDWMSPEMVRHGDTDADVVSDFYNATKRQFSSIGPLMAGPATAFQRFERALLALVKTAEARQRAVGENTELAHRLDVRRFEQIRQGVQQVQAAVARLAQVSLQGPTAILVERVVAAYENFVRLFTEAAPRVEAELARIAQNVPARWDMTRPAMRRVYSNPHTDVFPYDADKED